MKGKHSDVSAEHDCKRQAKYWMGSGFFTMPLNDATSEAQSRIAALLTAGRVEYHISHRAYDRAVNFKRRGGPEPLWCLYLDYDDVGTPEKEAKLEAALDDHWRSWTASLDTRHTQIFQALYASVEGAVRGGPGNEPWSGFIPFSVPADLAPDEPSLQLTVLCEAEPQDPHFVSLVIVCLDQTFVQVVPEPRMVLTTSRAACNVGIAGIKGAIGCERTEKSS